MQDGSEKHGGTERLSLLAAAVAGRGVGVVAGDDGRAYCDGERIVVAVGGDHDVRDAVAVQAALLAAGSLDARTVARLAGRRRARHRYLTLEAARATEALSQIVPRRVGERVAALYGGPVPASRDESLARALADAEDVPEAPEWVGTIRPGKLLLAAAPVGGTAPTEKDLERRSGAGDLPELDDEQDTDRSRILELFQAPAMQNPLAGYLQKLLGMGRTPEVDGSGGDELPVGSQRRGRVGANARTVAGMAAPAPELDRPPTGRLYPEWDAGARRYRCDWCAVGEYDPAPPARESLLRSGTDRRLLRELSRLGLAHERHRRQQEGDTLDVTALVELVVDRAAGAAGDERVYEAKRRTAHDLGVLVLLDASGSTGESDEGARVFDEQRDVAGRLAAALDELGNRVAVFGFQSWGRDVRYLRVKGFDDRYDHAARRRLGSVEPAGFTRLGGAVRHGTHLLSEKAGTTSTLLVVVGDGFPYDDGYEGRYAHEDCRRALAEAVGAGVGCACLSVRSSTEASTLRQVWGNVPYEVLDRPSELARNVAPLLRRALKEAAASRRRIKRREGVLT